jgi:hypothetical protein
MNEMNNVVFIANELLLAFINLNESESNINNESRRNNLQVLQDFNDIIFNIHAVQQDT